MKRSALIALIVIAAVIVLFRKQTEKEFDVLTDQPNMDDVWEQDAVPDEMAGHPPSIESLRRRTYPGSDVVIRETLNSGSNYRRFIASYESEGLTINALLTVPTGPNPDSGRPVIVFNHGYIPPAQHRTTERYVAYVDGFAKQGYIVLKPDYRGHGDSDGEPVSAYGSNGYAVDVLNSVASIKQFPDADPDRIGMWGHSLGGHLTLRAMVVSSDIKAGVIWAGVVGSYADLLNNWRRRNATPPPGIPTGARRWRQELVERFGNPEQNPEFWNSISATSFVADISGPLQLHHGTADQSVPVAFSESLKTLMENAGKPVELYTYPDDDHNLSQSFSTAMRRSVEFFDRYLK